MPLPSLTGAASFTNATTACVRSSCVTPATGDRSAANAAGSNGRRPSDAGAIACTPAPGRSRVSTAKPPASSIGVILSHAEWLCQLPWARTKTALGADVAVASSSRFTILTTCISGRLPFRRRPALSARRGERRGAVQTSLLSKRNIWIPESSGAKSRRSAPAACPSGLTNALSITPRSSKYSVPIRWTRVRSALRWGRR